MNYITIALSETTIQVSRYQVMKETVKVVPQQEYGTMRPSHSFNEQMLMLLGQLAESHSIWGAPGVKPKSLTFQWLDSCPGAFPVTSCSPPVHLPVVSRKNVLPASGHGGEDSGRSSWPSHGGLVRKIIELLLADFPATFDYRRV
jgi:hypothetical protein